MKSAVIATVFTYLIGALAAPLGSDTPRTENEARALDAVLSGTVPVSRRDAKLVNNLVDALAKRQESTSTPTGDDATSKDNTSSSVNPTPVVLPTPNVTPDSEAAPTATPLTKTEQKMVADALIKHGADEVAVRQMYADGLLDSLLGPVSGIVKILPIVGPILAGLLGTVGGVAGGLPVVGGLVGGAGGAGGANPLGAVTGLLGKVVGGVTGGVLNTVGDITKNPLGVLTDPVGTVSHVVGDVTDGVGKTVKGVAQVAGSVPVVGGVANAAGNVVGNAVQAAGKTLNGATGAIPLGSVTGRVPVAGASANSILKREIETSPEYFNKMLDDLQMTPTELWELYADLMKDMPQPATE
ncbi:hypothetical protein NQ176_g6464 [Zarea fungicola]|uniref:Uncharacterized protein n=1 Tax=Zarea fungicola TaxID=93591 RepID=A0ACC1N4K8_9HYPO|nr:hypothetical protein NQ176_g6464 [Lecanicillium fungicola]